MSRTVPKPVPNPAKAERWLLAKGTIQHRMLSVGNSGSIVSDENEPENAMTKNTGIATSGTKAAGMRKMLTRLRRASASATGTHEVDRAAAAGTGAETAVTAPS